MLTRLVFPPLVIQIISIMQKLQKIIIFGLFWVCGHQKNPWYMIKKKDRCEIDWRWRWNIQIYNDRKRSTASSTAKKSYFNYCTYIAIFTIIRRWWWRMNKKNMKQDWTKQIDSFFVLFFCPRTMTFIMSDATHNDATWLMLTLTLNAVPSVFTYLHRGCYGKHI